MARDAGAPDLAMQVLVYPVVDADFESASYRANGGCRTNLEYRAVVSAVG